MSSGLPGSKCLLSKWPRPPRFSQTCIGERRAPIKTAVPSKEQKSCCCEDTRSPPALYFPFAFRISTSAKEAHALNSVAPIATILNDVLTFSVGGAFLKLHCLFAYDADQETYEWTFIVVQMMSPGHSHRRET
jgi:hypothetical protein